VTIRRVIQDRNFTEILDTDRLRIEIPARIVAL
jgi:hypothetical protein